MRAIDEMMPPAGEEYEEFDAFDEYQLGGDPEIGSRYKDMYSFPEYLALRKN